MFDLAPEQTALLDLAGLRLLGVRNFSAAELATIALNCLSYLRRGAADPFLSWTAAPSGVSARFVFFGWVAFHGWGDRSCSLANLSVSGRMTERFELGSFDQDRSLALTAHGPRRPTPAGFPPADWYPLQRYRG